MAQRIKAWNCCVVILALQKLGLTMSLAHHMETVLSVAEWNAGWLCSDEHFSHMVSRQETEWGSTHLELYLKVILDHNSQY